MECAETSAYGLGAAAIIGIVGVAVAAAGTTYSVLASNAAAKKNEQLQRATAEQQQAAANLEALQEERNADIARQEASREADYQKLRERQQREQQQRLVGQMRADTAAAGLLMEGSPLFALHETLRQTELGLLASRTESQGRQKALLDEASQREFGASVIRYGGSERFRLGSMQAGISASQADQAFTGGLLQVGGQVAQGAGQAYKTYQYGKGGYGYGRGGYGDIG